MHIGDGCRPCQLRVVPKPLRLGWALPSCIFLASLAQLVHVCCHLRSICLLLCCRCQCKRPSLSWQSRGTQGLWL